jgi:hypothetical protein
MADMTLYKVVFSVAKQREGEAFKYFSSEREARDWLAEESPHDQTLEFDQDVEKVSIPLTRKGLAEYLNYHHVYWD